MSRVHTIADTKTKKNTVVNKKSNVHTLNDIEESEMESETECIVPKKQLNDLMDHNKFVIGTYQKDLVKAKGEEKILNERLKVLENMLEKQTNKLKQVQHQKEIMEDELNLYKTKKPYQKGGINLETVNITTMNSQLENDVEAYYQKNKNIDSYLQQMTKKYDVH